MITRSISLVMVIVLAVAVSATGAGHSAGQTRTLPNPKEMLERRLPNYEQETVRPENALVGLLSFAQIPAGMVMVANCAFDMNTVNWNPSGLTVRQALDLLVSEAPRYRWEDDGGVINFLPAGDIPPLLNVKIPRFEGHFSAPEEALTEIQVLPELRKSMSGLDVKWGANIYVKPLSRHPRNFTLQLKDVTLREALNIIARGDGRAVWTYVETRCDGKDEVVINF